ncbi:MAG: hypothetical protein NVSMB14_16550 [Isosphaeraceae bacterium]
MSNRTLCSILLIGLVGVCLGVWAALPGNPSKDALNALGLGLVSLQCGLTIARTV